VYYATKAYLISCSEALANEVGGRGITVTCLCPGATETAFAGRAGNDQSRLFKRLRPMDAKTAARAGYQGLLKGKTMVIPGVRNWLVAESVRFSPRKMATAVSRWVSEKAE
jgi:short-subunit dehydrogenase